WHSDEHGKLYRASERVFNRILNAYSSALRAVLRHPAVTLAVVLATISLNVLLFVVVPKGFFPQQDTGRLTGSIQAEQGISFQLMRRKLGEFVKIVMDDPAVSTLVAFTGGSGGSNTGRMYISLKDLDVRKIGVDQVIARIRKKASHVPGAALYMQAAQDIRVGGHSSSALYQFTLQSQDLSLLNLWAPRVMAKLRTLPQIVDLNTDQQNDGQ